MVCTYDFSGNCRAIRLCKPEIFEYRGFSPRITANSRDRELSLPQFALFVLFLPRLLRYTLEGAAVLRGGNFDPWDLEVRGGMFGNARMIMGIEEFGGGKQLVRFRIWPQFFPAGLFFSITWLFLSIIALI